MYMLPNQLRLVDGTIVRRCPTEKPLYCSRAGKFYSVHNAILTDDGWILHELKPVHSPNKPSLKNGHSHSDYPRMRNFGCRHCHCLVALTWIGPRPDGYEIDHLNGNIRDWSADNLEFVTPAENRKRAKLLRVLRSIGREPRQMTREELLEIFNKYTFTNH